MNVKGAFDSLGIFPIPQSELGGKPPLAADEKLLYDKIVKDLLLFYAERAKNSDPNLNSSIGEECALIFRQSKSWSAVEKKLLDISSTNQKIQTWVQSWLRRISDMRTFQAKIHALKHDIQEGTKRLQALPDSTSDIAKTTSQTLLKKKKRIANARKSIAQKLEEGKDNLARLNTTIAKDPACLQVVKFMTDNWLHLNVFYDWPEVSLDEERLSVQVQRPKPSLSSEEEIPFGNLVNSSTKAIFLIKQSDQEESPLEYEGVEPRKIIRTTKIELKDQHFAPESPAPRKRSPSFSMTVGDAYVFNTDFAQTKDEDLTDKVKATSATARKLERVVKRALRQVNSELPGDESSQRNVQNPGENSNPILLVIRAPIQHFFSWLNKTEGVESKVG